MLLDVSIPTEKFNEALREGTVSETLERIIQETKPESIYFTEKNGQRGATLIVDVKNPSQIPSIAEPWFLSFNADVEFRIAMTPEDFKNSGIEELRYKWTRELVV